MLSFHVKYVQTDGRTDGQMDNGKTICPRIDRRRGIKMQFSTSSILCCATIFWISANINSLPKGKILNWSKLKAFADNKINATEKLKFVLVGQVKQFVNLKRLNCNHKLWEGKTKELQG